MLIWEDYFIDGYQFGRIPVLEYLSVGGGPIGMISVLEVCSIGGLFMRRL